MDFIVEIHFKVKRLNSEVIISYN